MPLSHVSDSPQKEILMFIMQFTFEERVSLYHITSQFKPGYCQV